MEETWHTTFTKNCPNATELQLSQSVKSDIYKYTYFSKAIF